MSSRNDHPNKNTQRRENDALSPSKEEDHLDEISMVALDELFDGSGERRIFEIRRDIRRRLDVYLQQRLKGISRSKVQKLIELGCVTVNSAGRKASTVIRRGDRVSVFLPPPAIQTIEPEFIPLDVLYEDDAFIVINKQAGLIVHPARSHLSGTLINGLAHHFQQQIEQANGEWTVWQTRGFQKSKGRVSVKRLSDVGADEYRPGIVHRLDKNTTGVILVAKSDEAHWQIARQFQDRKTLKVYLAVVHGCPESVDAVGGVIEGPIGKHPTIREAFCIRHDSLGKPSVTLYRVRERYRGYTLLELELKTGRTHQLRVHLSHMGCPIVGDIVYGGEPIGQRELEDPPVAAGARRYLNFARQRNEGLAMETEAAARNDMIMARPALHATLLQLTHPTTQKQVSFIAPLHEPMATLLRDLRCRRIDGPVAQEGFWVNLETILPS